MFHNLENKTLLISFQKVFVLDHMSSSNNLSVKYYHIFQKFKFVYLFLYLNISAKLLYSITHILFYFVVILLLSWLDYILHNGKLCKQKGCIISTDSKYQSNVCVWESCRGAGYTQRSVIVGPCLHVSSSPPSIRRHSGQSWPAVRVFASQSGTTKTTS